MASHAKDVWRKALRLCGVRRVVLPAGACFRAQSHHQVEQKVKRPALWAVLFVLAMFGILVVLLVLLLSGVHVEGF